MASGRVNGKVVMVTGAASGIGRATATLLAREGATVVLTDVMADAGRALARELGAPHVFFQHDVSVVWDLAVHDLSIMDYVLDEKPAADPMPIS